MICSSMTWAQISRDCSNWGRFSIGASRNSANRVIVVCSNTMCCMVFEQPTMTLFAELREAPMENLPQLEQSLLIWAQVMLEHIMRPDYVALVRVLIAEIPRFPSLGSLFFSVLPQEGGSIVKALLERASAQGVISSVDLDAAIQLFVGPLLMHIIGALVRPDSSLQPPAPERVATLVRLFLHGVARHTEEQRR